MLKLLILISLTFSSIYAVGQSALVYMEIPVGSRQTAMGESFVSIADDPFTLMYNPAGLGLYPLDNGYDKIEMNSDYSLIDGVFKYDNNPEILILLTNKGLIEYDNSIIKTYYKVLLSPDETVEDVVRKWITDEANFTIALEEVVRLNNLSDIDYNETQIFELEIPYSIITNEKINSIKKAPNEDLLLVCDSTIIFLTANGCSKLGYDKGLRGKIKGVDFKDRTLWVMTEKALFSLDNYEIIDQTSIFNPVTSKSLRAFWDTFDNFKVLSDSTLWLTSKDYGVLEYKLNSGSHNNVEVPEKKSFTFAALVQDTASVGKIEKIMIGNSTVFCFDSLVLNHINRTVEDSLVDSTILASISNLKYDSLFLSLDSAKSFLSIYEVKYQDNVAKLELETYAKDFISYEQVFNKNVVSDILELDSVVMVLSEGIYFTKKENKWNRYKMENLKSGTFIGQSGNEIFIKTSSELLKYNIAENIWSIEIEKNSIAGAFSKRGIFLISENEVNVFKKTSISMGFDYQSLIPKFDANNDMFILSAPIVIPNIPIGALGFSINYVTYGVTENVDDKGTVLGTIHPMDLNFGAHWGVALSNNQSIGIGFKGYYSKLGTGYVDNQKAEPAVGWLADIGYLYRTPMINFGVSLMNLGTPIVYVDDNQADDAPSVFTAGVSSKIKFSDFTITPTIDFSRNIWEQNDSTYDEATKTNEANSAVYEQLSLISPHGGFEFVYADLLALRAGYLFDVPGKRSYMPVGGGVKLKDISVFNDFHLDFTYILNGFGDPFGNGEESVNAGTFKITITSRLK